MNEFIYPALFTPDTEEGGYLITFPDLPDVITEGDSLTEAFHMAKEALGAYLEMCIDAGDALPEASAPDSIKIESGFVSLIDVDIVQFKMQYSNKAVKKTLTLPEWLNSMAESRQVNFSQVLQEALRERLGV
jgi:predicted RNase H-like HicB family nuclease